MKTGTRKGKIELPEHTPAAKQIHKLSRRQNRSTRHKIDIKIGEYSVQRTTTSVRGKIDKSLRLKVEQLYPGGRVDIGKIPHKIALEFNDEVLYDYDDVRYECPQIPCTGDSYLSIRIDKFTIYPDGPVYRFNDDGELVKSEGSDEGDGQSEMKINKIQNIQMEDFVMNRSQVGTSEMAEEQFCTGCGENIEDTAAAFCPYCGTEL